MEDLNLIDDMEMEGGLNAQMKDYMMETAKWAKFIAIVMIVMAAFAALSGLVQGASFVQMFAMMGIGASMAGILLVFIYLIILAILLVPNLYLLKFANNTKAALNSGSESQLTDAFSNLKFYFKFWGIVIAVYLILYALILIYTISAAI